ncbi:MAG: hypothetical protein HY547_05725 [Elusimicrobia bacterium]|nr:hypothetical protein [Elusimicrobiota bacterium]
MSDGSPKGLKQPLIPQEPNPIPSYELTTDGFKEIVPDSAPWALAPNQAHHWRRFFLLVLLAASLMNYGIEAPVVKSWIEARLESESSKIGLEPYRLWARHHPLSYDEVLVSPAAYSGKAVIWSIGIDNHGIYFEAANPANKLEIAGLSSGVTLFPDHGGAPARVLARIEESPGDAPLLTILERMPWQ